MFFFLGAKFNRSIVFDIRGKHEVLKVTFKVIRVSKTALGAERRTCMTNLAYINDFSNTLHLVGLYRVIILSSSIHNIAFVIITCINESRQTPVITLDQPLYAIAKAIQWDTTTRFNEDNYFVFLGPLHKEMLCENMVGDWARDSGWVELLIDADVTSPGRAETLAKGSHVTWTRYAE